MAKQTTKKKAGEEEVSIDRRGAERRKDPAPAAPERRAKTARRRQIDPTTCERDYSGDEIEFMHALDAYKRRAGRMFPTCSEVLEVLRDLGYARLTPEQKAWLDKAPVENVDVHADIEVDSSDDTIIATADELVAG